MSVSVTGRRAFAAAALAAGFFFVGTHNNKPHFAGPLQPPPAQLLDSKFTGHDAVTEAIRSDANDLTRIFVKTSADREAAARVGRIIEDFGSFLLVAKNRVADSKQFGLEQQRVETTINLPGATFDPVRQPPGGTLRLGPAATANGNGYYVLQFGGTVKDEWLRSVRDAGVDVLQYVSHQAYFVYGSAEAIARVANHSRVRWIGEFRPEHKISAVVRHQLASELKGIPLAREVSPIRLTQKGTTLFDVAVFSRADLNEVAESLKQNFGKGFFQITRLPNNYLHFIRIEARLEDAPRIAEIPDVIAVEPHISSKNEDERSAQILAGNFINSTTIQGPGYDPLSQFGTDGTGVTVSVVDDGVGIPGEGGFYISPLTAVNAPLRNAPSGAFGHGHLNATIIAGAAPYGPLDPLSYSYGKGIAPGANVVSIPRNRAGYTGTDADVYSDSLNTPGPNGSTGRISNNSWGNGTNGNAYNTYAAQFDGFVRDASTVASVNPITLIFSAGNDGAAGLTQPKSAKNIIAVGNSESLRTDLGGTGANNINDLASNSSRGPTADGRIKPDIVAPGTAITGGRSGTDSLSGNIDNFHRWSSGTSHSAAHVSGMAALFSSWRRQQTGDLLSPSLIKAALINSAQDINGANASAPVPNGSEGWGRPNMKMMFNTGTSIKYINEEIALQENGGGSNLVGSVLDGTKPVRVTLAWTDPPGVADPSLVNDLDLIVTVGGITYKGNVFSSGSSVSGGTADSRDNVENVFLPAGIPTGTSLEVLVRATALNGDGILNNGDPTDQKYSLVVYNYSELVGPSFYRLSGKLISPAGRGIGSARVRLTDSQGIVREAMSNPLGYFTFLNVAGGQSYTVNVTAKRYSFFQQTVDVSGNMSNLNFVSSGGAP